MYLYKVENQFLIIVVQIQKTNFNLQKLEFLLETLESRYTYLVIYIHLLAVKADYKLVNK